MLEIDHSKEVYIPWQACPVCRGSGAMSGGFFNRAGDCPTWSSSASMETCQVCKGRGIILMAKKEG